MKREDLAARVSIGPPHESEVTRKKEEEKKEERGEER